MVTKTFCGGNKATSIISTPLPYCYFVPHKFRMHCPGINADSYCEKQVSNRVSQCFSNCCPRRFRKKDIAKIASHTERLKHIPIHVCDKTAFFGCPSTERRRIISFHYFCPSVIILENTLN
jgi:hypothetical protein